MKKIFNYLFYGLKYLLLIAAFAISLFIMMRMNIRLEKSFTSIIPELIPFLLLLIIFVINIILSQKQVTNNLFYNITCCLVLSTILFVGYRAIFDKNMVLNEKYGYGIDFNFFDNFISYIKIMLYGLIIGNIFFMFKEREESRQKKV